MKRRELFRQTLFGAIGSAATSFFRGAAAEPRHAAREYPPNYDASKDLARQDWKPVFLDPHQNETLIALSDMILPKTDTPGAKEALVMVTAATAVALGLWWLDRWDAGTRFDWANPEYRA